jgi:thymidylate synthase ThyX
VGPLEEEESKARELITERDDLLFKIRKNYRKTMSAGSFSRCKKLFQNLGINEEEFTKSLTRISELDQNKLIKKYTEFRLVEKLFKKEKKRLKLSWELMRTNDLDEVIVAQFDEMQTDVWNTCKAAYDNAIRMGVSREQARFLLPLSTSTTLYMTGNIRSWILYLQLRSSESTQEEHRIIAEQISVIFKEHFPAIEQAMTL